jgi:chromosome segregation ATPase
MPEIEVTVFNQKLKLSYQDNEKQRLINAVETLNNSWSKFSDLHGKVTDLKIITLISLELQDSLDGMHALKDNEAQLVNKIELLQKEIKSKNAQLEEGLEKIKKYETDLSEKKHEISKVENILDELNIEVSNIKNNILKKKDE